MNLKTKSRGPVGIGVQDKVVLITGGAKGIGSGCARVFVGAGAKVMIGDRDAVAGRKLAQELDRSGPGACLFRRCDVSKPAEFRALIAATVKRFGRLDCLINNAGFHPATKRIDEFTLAELQEVWRVNFVSQFVGCQCALPHLRKTRGAIINIGSLVATIGQEGATTYCATKGATSAFTKALAIDEAHHGVRVNVVLPGNVMTDGRIAAVRAMPRGKEVDRWVESNQHLGRSATIEEVGRLCLFLASDASSYITGAELPITAGAELGYGIKFPPRFIGGERPIFDGESTSAV